MAQTRMDWVSEQLLLIEARKIELEAVVHKIRILLNPWPTDDIKDEADLTKNEKDVCHEREVEDLSPALTVQEQHSVSMVDKLLQKAQKAREIQKKLEEPKKARKERKAPPQEESDSSKPKRGISSSGSNQQSNQTRPLSAAARPTSAKLGSKNEQVASREIHISQPKHSQPGQKREVKVAERMRGGSAGRKVTPAHASAPFQTNPRLATAKLQTTYRASTSQTANRGKNATHNSRGRGGKSSGYGIRNIASGHSKNSGSESTSTNRPLQSRVLKEEVIEKQQYHTLSSNHTNEFTEEIKTLGQALENDVSSSSKKQETHIDEMIGEINDQVKELQVKEQQEDAQMATNSKQERFELLKDGASIQLPSKLKKYIIRNRKLRQKLYTESMTTKINSPQPRQQFLSRIEETFVEEDVQTQLQARQAEYILSVYTNLADLLASLQLHTVPDNASPAEVLRAKKIMEYLLVTFHETEEMLHQSDFSLLSQACVCPPGNLEEPQPPQHRHLSLWYPRCGSTLQGLNSKPARLTYTRYRQLEKYTGLVFKLQLQQLQLDLMEEAAALVLPLLHTLDPSSSEFVQVLRQGYSLLSTNPNGAPVVVRDTIQDETCDLTDDPDLNTSITGNT